MTIKVTNTGNQQVSPGRSPEAEKIYQQYLTYYNDINTKIRALDALPYNQRNQPSVQQARSQLQELQKQLYPRYTDSYNNSRASLSSFQSECVTILNQITAVYNQAIGQGGSAPAIHDAIQKNYDMAKNIISDLNQQITQNQASLNALQADQTKLTATLSSLQAQIDTLPSTDARKAKAINDFKTANQALTTLGQTIKTIQTNIQELKNSVAQLSASSGALTNLQKLAAAQNPTQAQLDQANGEMANLKSVQTKQTSLDTLIANGNNALKALNNAIVVVQNDLASSIPTPAPTGRSRDADKIYQQYLDYYNDINIKIQSLNSLPLEQRNQVNIQDAKNILVTLQQQLHSKYTSSYNNSQATLSSFQNDCTSIENQVLAIYNNAIGQGGGAGTSIQDVIKRNYTQAQNTASALNQQIAQDQSALAQLQSQEANFMATLSGLQAQIAALDATDPKKAQAQADLNAVNQALSQLHAQIATLQSQLMTIQGLAQSVSGPNGLLSQIQALANTSSPTQANLDSSQAILQQILSVHNQEKTTFQATLLGASNSVQSINTLMQKTQASLSSSPGLIEHATWYINWTSWDYPVPEGVNTVNIFVGNMHLDGQGNPIIDGFGTLNEAKMRTFVQQCHAQGIAVKISLGGGGGAYDHCWSNLTANNVSAFAQKLSQFCTSYGLDGVDFDIEEFKSPTDRPTQQQLCGRFIKEFKTLSPTLSTSLCTNAGFGPYFPWPGIVQNIFEGASTLDVSTGQKTCAIDRLYIMSYYDPIENEKAWILGWYNWLKTNYNYQAYQVTVGIDDKDAHAYDIREMAKFAAEYGFSTGYWEYDPARASDSNESTNAIEDAYYNSSNIRA